MIDSCTFEDGILQPVEYRPGVLEHPPLGMLSRMSDRERLEGAWRITSQRLEEARRALTSPDDEALPWYEDCLRSNELGLALDALSDVAIEQRAPRAVWDALLAAANSMGLHENDAVHGRTVARIKERLSIRQEWFELRRLLNEWDPIGVYDPDTDLPLDEYDCLYGPLMSRLGRGDSVNEIAGFLNTELQEHFGTDPTPARPDEFARRLVAWFKMSTP